MGSKIKSPEDFWGGLMCIAIGAFAMIVARDYPMGSALRMGPGYFPTWLGGIMIFLGAWILIESFIVAGHGIGAWAWRPLLVLTGALVAFGVLMDTVQIGFVPALMVVILGCGLAHDDVKWMEIILLSIFLTAGCVALFIYVIGLPYPLFWWQ